MEVNTVNLYGNFAYEFSGNVFHQQIGGPPGTQAATIAAMIPLKKWKKKLISLNQSYTSSVTWFMYTMGGDGGFF